MHPTPYLFHLLDRIHAVVELHVVLLACIFDRFLRRPLHEFVGAGKIPGAVSFFRIRRSQAKPRTITKIAMATFIFIGA